MKQSSRKCRVTLKKNAQKREKKKKNPMLRYFQLLHERIIEPLQKHVHSSDMRHGTN